MKKSRVSNLLQQQVEKTLQSLCLSVPIQKSLLGSISDQLDFESAWEKVGRQIKGAVAVERTEIIDHAGVVALVGPTGSGKTMTIGKMAARYVMKYGAENVALVTTDRYRIAAHEQLKVFGRILNVPVHTVDETNNLDTILDSLSHKKMVLIDTAGLMHSDACWSEQLQELKLSKHGIKSYLVVSAVGQYQVMCSNYYNYKVVGLSGAIITKVDEAVSLGEALSFLIDTRLKASYFTDGQRVPEDIHLMKKQDLFDRAQALLNSSERWVTINSNETGHAQDSFLFHTA
jgi:flagellar biosynthesis protein FlhF